MALIYVKRRKDPIKISNDRALAVKDAKFGNGNTPKADNEEFLDLGIWAGQFGEIVQIELDEIITRQASQAPDYEAEKKAEEDAMRKLSKEDLAKKHLRMISLWKWFSWSKMAEKEAPQEAQDFMLKKLTDFFKKNTNEIYPPKDLVEAFREKYFGKSTR